MTKSLSLYSGSHLDENIQQLMYSKSNKVGRGGNTTLYDDNKFMKNIFNDLTTLVNKRETIAM